MRCRDKSGCSAETGQCGNKAGWGAGTGPAGQPQEALSERATCRPPRSLLTGAHPPRKFLMTSFLEPPVPPGLAGPPANAAGLVRPLVRPMRAETLPFRGPSSAMAGPDAAPPRAVRLLLLPCARSVRARLLLLLLSGSARERSAPPPSARGLVPRAGGPTAAPRTGMIRRCADSTQGGLGDSRTFYNECSREGAVTPAPSARELAALRHIEGRDTPAVT